MAAHYGPDGKPLFPVYVWHAATRFWHWTMAVCMVLLAATGYLIGSPPPSIGGEAYDQFLFGWIRLIHFGAGYVFAAVFLLRVLYMFIGTKFEREIFLVPLYMFRPSWWQGLFRQAAYYLFLTSKTAPWQGHNPLAMAAMFFMYVLGTIFMIVTGFALYGEGAGMGTWQYAWFSSWVIPLLGNSQYVHTWHHLGMWYLLMFTVVHVYMVVREDIFSGETVISTMVNGWRVTKP
jgi:Ni/Fe-hydrogenase 1 B-type cytochrome subunit